MKHGGAGTGYSQGCRCDECRQANTARAYRRKAERYALVAAHGLPAHVAHGSAAYRNWGCRCDICTAANSAACAPFRRAWQQRQRDLKRLRTAQSRVSHPAGKGTRSAPAASIDDARPNNRKGE